MHDYGQTCYVANCQPPPGPANDRE